MEIVCAFVTSTVGYNEDFLPSVSIATVRR